MEFGDGFIHMASTSGNTLTPIFSLRKPGQSPQELQMELGLVNGEKKLEWPKAYWPSSHVHLWCFLAQLSLKDM